MTGECIDCGSQNTELWRGDDGHFRKVCEDCGYVAGPFVSDRSNGGPGSEQDKSRAERATSRNESAANTDAKLTDFVDNG